jgi:hypothetical protein
MSPASWDTLDEPATSNTTSNRASRNGKAPAAKSFAALFGFPIKNPRRWSQNVRTAIEVDGPNDERIRWERQIDLASPKLLAMPVVAARLHAPRKLPTVDQAVAVYGELVEACEIVEAEDATEEPLSWAQAVLNHCDRVIDIGAMEAAAAWLAWRHVQGTSQMTRSDLAGWLPPVVTDGVYEYVRQSDVAAYARQIDRVALDWEGLRARMREAGWAFHFVQLWEPGVPRDDADRAVVRTFRRRLGA